MSKQIPVDVYVHLNVKHIDVMDSMSELAFQYFHADMSENSYFKGEYIFIEKKTILVNMPETHELAGSAADNLEQSLAKMRAEHHRAQQELIDQIAGFRMLCAPKEGEVLNDRDLRSNAPSKFHDADDAEDVNEVPF